MESWRCEKQVETPWKRGGRKIFNSKFQSYQEPEFPSGTDTSHYPCCPGTSAGCRSWEIHPSAVSWSGFQSIATGATGQLNSLPKEIWGTQCPDWCRTLGASPFTPNYIMCIPCICILFIYMCSMYISYTYLSCGSTIDCCPHVFCKIKYLKFYKYVKMNINTKYNLYI